MHRIFLPVICKTNVPTYIIIAYLYIWNNFEKEKKIKKLPKSMFELRISRLRRELNT